MMMVKSYNLIYVISYYAVFVSLILSLSLSLSASSSLLSLSSRHLREISDPISQLLSTLHRLLSLTLSAPSLHPHSARLLVLDRYQRSLFHSDMSPDQVKGELHRLSSRTVEGVWLLEEGVWSVGPRLLNKAIREISGKMHRKYLYF